VPDAVQRSTAMPTGPAFGRLDAPHRPDHAAPEDRQRTKRAMPSEGHEDAGPAICSAVGAEIDIN